MSEYFKSFLYCSTHKVRFSSSRILNHLKTGQNHSISKLIKFKDKNYFNFFNQKLNSTKFYLRSTKKLNDSAYNKITQKLKVNLFKIQKIYQIINEFIEKNLIFIEFVEGRSVFNESMLEFIKNIMTYKSKIVIDYEYFEHFDIDLNEISNILINFEFRKSFCKKKLSSSLVSTPVCGVVVNESLLIVGCNDSTIKWFELPNQSIIFNLTLQKSQSNILSLYDSSQKLISCCENGLIYVFDIKTKVTLKIIEDHESSIEASDLNLNQTLFLTADKLQNIKIWRLDSWELKYSIRDEVTIYSIFAKFLQFDKIVIIINNNFKFYSNGEHMQGSNYYLNEQININNFYANLNLNEENIPQRNEYYINHPDYIEVSKCKTFLILLYYNKPILKININNNQVEEIAKNQRDEYFHIRLSNSDKYLIALRRINVSIINMDTKTIVEVNTFLFTKVYLPYKNSDFLLLNEYHILKHICNQETSVPLITKEIFDVFDYKLLKIDKTTGIIHFISNASYFTFNVLKDSITKDSSDRFSCLALIPSTGAILLGTELGNLLIRLGNNQKKIFEFDKIEKDSRFNILKISNYSPINLSTIRYCIVSNTEKFILLSYRCDLIVILKFSKTSIENIHYYYYKAMDFALNSDFSQSDRFLITCYRYGSVRIDDLVFKSRLFEIYNDTLPIRVIFCSDERYVLCLLRNQVIKAFDWQSDTISWIQQGRIITNNDFFYDIKKIKKYN